MSLGPRNRPPFRADHVGSLVRPAELIDARRGHLEGRIAADALGAIEDRCIVDAIRLQEDAGLLSVTDGEFRRSTWRDAFMDALDGFGSERHEAAFAFRNAAGESHKVRPVPVIEGRLRRGRGVATADFGFLKKHTTRTAKQDLPSPTSLHFFIGPAGIPKSIYPDLDAFHDDVARIYIEELEALAALGCAYVQLDEVSLALLCDDRVRGQIADRGEEPERVVDAYIEVIATVLKSKPRGMAICLHLCRGNSPRAWIGEAGYERVAERLFGALDADGYFLEYDTDRAGDFTPLRHAGDGKVVVLGLVSTKRAELESPELLKRRIAEAARYVPLDRLCLSPQCGFASGFGSQPMTIEREREKLRLIVDVAGEVWAGR
jgi:5-methyltetrahydropteroyltriglutamate--homocysteine methyltransferase